MGRTTQRLVAAGIASGALLTGGWLATNAQAAGEPDACSEVIRLTEEMVAVNHERIGTMAARSGAMRMGWDAKVKELTPKHLALVYEYDRLHTEFQSAAKACR